MVWAETSRCGEFLIWKHLAIRAGSIIAISLSPKYIAVREECPISPYTAQRTFLVLIQTTLKATLRGDPP